MSKLLLVFSLVIPFSGHLNAQIFINELMSSNNSVIVDEAGEFDDWIEIYNAGATPIDLNGYYISDDFSDPEQFQFSASMIIPSNGFILIWADKDEDQGPTHTNFKLNSSGEQVILTAPNGVTIVDSITIPAIPEDLTYGRLTDGGNQLDILSPPSPNSSNNNSLSRTLKPTISLASGSYAGHQTTTIESETGSTIYFTIDGAIPSIESDVYTGPITINSSLSVRAIAVKPGFEQSFITTHSYLIDFYSSLPVLFITMDPIDLYSDTAGIYVTGTNGITGYCSGEIAHNWNQDWERPAHLKVFINGGLVAENNLGIKIGGNCKRKRPQKPLNLNFKDKYGDDGDNEFNYQIFPDNDLDKFKRLFLRTGNREFKDLMKDIVVARMMEPEIDIETQSGQPTIVFINGEYIGIQNLREKYDRWHFEQDYNKVVDRDSVDIIKNPGRYYPDFTWWANQRATHGDTTAYREFVNYLKTVDFTNQSEFEEVSALIDYDELLNYMSIGHFFSMSDWVGNNEKVWRSRQTNGKWRWCLVDFDSAIRLDKIHINPLNKLLSETPRGYSENAEATLLYRGMFSNNTFRDEYIQRMNTYLELLFVNEKFDPVIDGFYSELLPDLPLANNLYGHTLAAYQSEIQNQKDFVNQRTEYVRQNLSSTFGLTDTIEISFNVDTTSNGSVNLHSNYYKIPDNYQGWYHRNIPLEIHAIPDPGYRFSHWEETGSTNANLYQSFNTNTSLTPIFVRAIDLVINEIHYNPLGSSNAPEFIELYNPDTEAKPLNAYKFSEGICFEFPEGYMIGAGEYVIVAYDANLYEGNGYQVFEWEASKLKNSGEQLHLVNRNEQTIDLVEYEDESPWNSEPQQGIKSLALIDANLDNSLPENWCVQQTDITPGAMNVFLDADNDLIIDCIDTCPGFNNDLIGTSCDDGNPFTFNDVVGDNCDCAGTTCNSTENLALGGTATQISTRGNGVASRAIDGNTNGIYSQGSVTHTYNEIGAWWEVELATDGIIDEISIYNRTDCCESQLSDFTVSVINNAGATVFSQVVSDAPSPSASITVGGVIGRTVRIQLNGTGYLSLAEVEVMGCGFPPSTTCNSTENLALGGTATQTSTRGNGVASRAIDGNTNGVYTQGSATHTYNEIGAWWEVELATDGIIDEISIYNRTDCCESQLSDFTVSVINNAGATVFSQVVSDAPSPSASITVGGVIGRTVRIQLNGTGYLSLAEVEVMGCSNAQSAIQASEAAGVANEQESYDDLVALDQATQQESFDDVKLYPVPTHTTLIVLLPEYDGYSTMQIIDALGSSVIIEHNVTATRSEIDVSNLPAGIYWLSVLDHDKSVLTMKKFIVQ